MPAFRCSSISSPATAASRLFAVSSRQAQRQTQQPVQRRAASHAAHDAHGHHGHDHGHAEPVNISLGSKFYLAIAGIPASILVYKAANPSSTTTDTTDANTANTAAATSKPLLTRLMEKYAPDETAFERRNAAHTAALEQAAHDRHLFVAQQPELNLQHAYPETLNVNPIINAPAGYRADLSVVIAHEEKKRAAMEADRVARMKDGRVVSVYD